jgi:hypothetical protein
MFLKENFTNFFKKLIVFLVLNVLMVFIKDIFLKLARFDILNLNV